MCEYCGCRMNMLDYEGENDPDFDPEKADRNKDGKISDWERSVGNAVAKSMREQKEKKSAEEFESEFSKGDMLNLRKYIDYPLDWINENFIPKDMKKARKSDQRMRGQIPTKRSSDDFRKGVRTQTPLWFKAIQGAIIAVAVGAISFKGMSEMEEPEEPEREKEE